MTVREDDFLCFVRRLKNSFLKTVCEFLHPQIAVPRRNWYTCGAISGRDRGRGSNEESRNEEITPLRRIIFDRKRASALAEEATRRRSVEGRGIANKNWRITNRTMEDGGEGGVLRAHLTDVVHAVEL